MAEEKDLDNTIELLTAEAVAELLKVKPRQLKDRICKRHGFPRPLNPRVMGSIKRWKKSDIVEWIENGGRCG